MTTQSPYVGQYAEYYARKTLRSALRPEATNALIQENENLRQQVAEMSNVIEYYEQQIKILKSHAKPKSALMKLLIRLGLFSDDSR